MNAASAILQQHGTFYHPGLPGQLTLHPSGVTKSSTSFGWGKDGKVTAAGWQVTLCDPIWHVISHSGEVISITNCYIGVYLFTLPNFKTELRLMFSNVT